MLYRWRLRRIERLLRKQRRATTSIHPAIKDGWVVDVGKFHYQIIRTRLNAAHDEIVRCFNHLD